MDSFSDATLRDFIARAASDAPTPGGGGVAALVGALGGAMAAMAANFTVDRPKFAEYEALMRATLSSLHPIIDDFRMAIDEDAAAFSGISRAYALPRGDEAEKAVRKNAVAAALTASMRVPLRVLRRCGEAAELLPPLARSGNPNLLSDVLVAAIMLEASARAAMVNVLINSRSLKTEEARAAESEGEGIVNEVAGLTAEVRGIIEGRG